MLSSSFFAIVQLKCFVFSLKDNLKVIFHFFSENLHSFVWDFYSKWLGISFVFWWLLLSWRVRLPGCPFDAFLYQAYIFYSRIFAAYCVTLFWDFVSIYDILSFSCDLLCESSVSVSGWREDHPSEARSHSSWIHTQRAFFCTLSLTMVVILYMISYVWYGPT